MKILENDMRFYGIPYLEDIQDTAVDCQASPKLIMGPFEYDSIQLQSIALVGRLANSYEFIVSSLY